jgi:hypothetical protein
MKDSIKGKVILSNSLHFIRVFAVHDPDEEKRLDDAFTFLMETYLDKQDRECIGGFDSGKYSLYFMYIDQWKVNKIIAFFGKHNLLIRHEIVTDPVRFICSNEEYLGFYNDENNKDFLDKFILSRIDFDYILDRYNENRNVPGFALLPIEMEILKEYNLYHA